MVKPLQGNGWIILGLALLLGLPPKAASQVVSRTNTVIDDPQNAIRSQYQSLKQVLNELGEQYEVNIVFRSKVIRDKMVRTEWLQGSSVESALENILGPLGLTFQRVADKDYVIKEKAELPEKVQKLAGDNSLDLRQDNMQEFQGFTRNGREKKIASIRNRLQDRIITGKVSDENGEAMPGVSRW